MPYVLSQSNKACNRIRKLHTTPASLKKLVGSIKTEFRKVGLDIMLKTKKDHGLADDFFYVEAYYYSENDVSGEVAIEIIIFHNFKENSTFLKAQITDLLIQIYDSVIHECKHRAQSQARNHVIYKEAADVEPYSLYLSDDDELDAYSVSIAVELLRSMPANRAKMYMTRMTVLARLHQNSILVSSSLQAYIDTIKSTKLLRKLAKKVYKNLDMLDAKCIFK
jgi:hypothetical protein